MKKGILNVVISVPFAGLMLACSLLTCACKESEEVYADFFVSASADCTQAHLSWNALRADSSLLYSLYLNDLYVREIKGTSCDLVRLKGNTPYSGHVIAHKGDRICKQANFYFVTENYPAVTDFKLRAKLITSDSVALSWTKPIFPYGGECKFTINVNGRSYESDSSTLSFGLGGLTPLQSCYFVVSAFDTLQRTISHTFDIVTLRTPGARLMQQSLVCGDYTRDFWLYIPSHSDGSALPLFVFLHGAGGDAFRNMKNFSLKELAETNKFAVAMPQALSATTSEGTFTQWNDHQVLAWDDALFLHTMLDNVAETYPIDASRTFLSGMSNGGFMTLYMATLSTRFAAIAPMSGLITYANQKKLINWPLPMLMIHGTDDSIVQYNGGGYCASVDDLVKFWASKNGCDSVPSVVALPDLNVKDGSTVTLYDYAGSDARAKVRLYKVIGGGHSVAGNETGSNMDIDAFKVAWDFFKLIPSK